MVTVEDTIQLLFSFILKDFMTTTYVFFQKILLQIAMGHCFSLNEPKVTIINDIPKGNGYDYLRPEG